MQWMNSSSSTQYTGIPMGPGHVSRDVDDGTGVVVDTSIIVLNQCLACGASQPFGLGERVGGESADEWWARLEVAGLEVEAWIVRHLADCPQAERVAVAEAVAA